MSDAGGAPAGARGAMNMTAHVGRKDFQRAAHQAHDAVGMPARPPAGYLTSSAPRAGRATAGPAVPSATAPRSAAIAGKPEQAGPHCPALYRGHEAGDRAVSLIPHEPVGRTTSTPAPIEAPTRRSSAGANAVPRASPDNQGPRTLPPVPPPRAPSSRASSMISETGCRWPPPRRPGGSTPPLMVTKQVPGASGAPTSLNQSAP